MKLLTSLFGIHDIQGLNQDNRVQYALAEILLTQVSGKMSCGNGMIKLTITSIRKASLSYLFSHRQRRTWHEQETSSWLIFKGLSSFSHARFTLSLFYIVPIKGITCEAAFELEMLEI